MKIKHLLLILLFYNTLATSLFAQSEKITLKMENVSINEVLTAIESKSEYKFLVNERTIDLKQKTSVNFVETSIADILGKLFDASKTSILVKDRQIIIAPKTIKEESGPVKGRVTDSKTNEALPGATIIIKSTGKGTITSFDGTFEIVVTGDKEAITISYVGYNPMDFEVKPGMQLDVRMTESSIMINDVVVTALGIKREEKAVGYAIQKMDGDKIQTVKHANPTTTLTGKVAGLTIFNSTNFGQEPVMMLRGENPLVVIDGIPNANTTLNDISPDDIKSIDVLKGATASALYGSRGANGAIMITTLKGKKEPGLTVSLNSSTMFNLGFITTPETQKSYSSGEHGKYSDDFVWGDKLDIGRTTSLWDPFEMVWKDSVPLVSKGKDNLKNFQELGLISNNNINITNQGENGSLRASISHVYEKGQFPNQKLNKATYSLSGEMKLNGFNLESGVTYSKHISPNIRGNQYSGGFLYNLVGWVGAEWDINEYKNYWMEKNISQNWFNTVWYDNPWYLANEVITTADRDIMNGYASLSYQLNPWMKLMMRSGLDFYLNRSISRNPISSRNSWSSLGYYSEEKTTGYSLNNDLILNMNKTFGDLQIEGLAGGTIYFKKDDYFQANTKGGLSVPGFYSLRASKDPIEWDTDLKRQQVNSLFGRLGVSFKRMAYLDVTGRNDWNSTLSEAERSYFYPSVSGSFVLSEVLPAIQWLDFWKLRSSWTVTKATPGVYDIATNFTILNESWGGYNSAYYPLDLRGSDIEPTTSQTFEFGTAAIFFSNKLKFDLTYYQKRKYNLIDFADISDATGFSQKYINIDTETTKKGLELTFGVTPVATRNLKWNINFNWAKDITYYTKLDSLYTEDLPWIKVGNRVDVYSVYDWQRDPDGNIIHQNGMPVISNYQSVHGYSNPDWVWGVNSELQYKSFTFGFSVDGRVGGMSFSRLDALLWHSGAHIDTDNQWRYDEVVNGLTNYVGPGVKVVSGTVEYDTYGQILSDTRVFEPNDVEVSYEGYIRRYHTGAWSWRSQNILDETFLKLRELYITWKVPADASSKIGLSDLSISIVGQNLLYWGKEYKMTDPDYGSSWDLVSPSIRYFGLNLKTNF